MSLPRVTFHRVFLLFFLVSWVSLSTGIPCVSQESTRADGGPPAKVADVLTQHHIPLTKDALLSALHSDDPQIRELAASQLADEGYKDTIPAIVEALEAEHVPLAKVNIASSLAYLGDVRGIQALRQDCNDTSLPMAYRLTAVTYLVNYHHDESCWKTVVEGSQSRYSSGDRVQSLSLIPDFKKLSAERSAMFRALLLNGLHDEDPGVRIEAGDVLRTMGDVAAIPALEAAIAAETSPDVRSTMESELRGLQKMKQ